MKQSAVRLLLVLSILLPGGHAAFGQAEKPFRAGARAVDITAPFGPLIRNGGFLEGKVGKMSPGSLHARCIVLDDGDTRLALAVVDSCMVTREVCDEAKTLAGKATGIPIERILISATHTHSAPSVMDFCLGTRADPAYTKFLPPKIAEGIELAAADLQPARIGWTRIAAPEFTNCRRWIMRPDTMQTDPFGRRTVRAMMHPGHQNPAFVGPAGPTDPDLSLLALQTVGGKPLAVLANYSMHYYGGGPADYFGIFAARLASRLTEDHPGSDPVCIMSQGTSGDLHWMDYSRPRNSIGPSKYADGLAGLAQKAMKSLAYHDHVPLGMHERRLIMARRRPDEQRLDWARKILDGMKGARPRNKTEVYAEQAVYIHENPEVEVVLQALRIGKLGIAALPSEVYGITGLKLKAQSPFAATFNMELANGAAGYIPPPEQHRLGGYTTWPARTAGLEVPAEPKMVEKLLASFEKLAGRKRRPLTLTHGSYAQAVLDADPLAYWRFEEFGGPTAADAADSRLPGTFHGGRAYYLPGPAGDGFSGTGRVNRAVHFAGGWMTAEAGRPGDTYSLSLWLWNGMPENVRDITGHVFAHGGDRLYIGGKDGQELAGKLVFEHKGTVLSGRTPLGRRQWHHVVLSRSREKVSVYLNGSKEAELDGGAPVLPSGTRRWHLAGDGVSPETFEGKIDEVAAFPRALTAVDAERLYKLSGLTPPHNPTVPPSAQEKASDAASLAKYAEAVRKSKPIAYWRLHDPDRSRAEDASDNRHHGLYERGAAPRRPGGDVTNFSGGRMGVEIKELGDTYSVELWFCNTLPVRTRPVTGYLFSRGEGGDRQAAGDHLGIGGTHSSAGRLIVFNGNRLNRVLSGTTELRVNSWNHVVMVREKTQVTVYLNGDAKPEINGDLPSSYALGARQLFVGGRNDNFANFQGRIDEAAVYDRALRSEDIMAHYRAAGLKAMKVMTGAGEGR
ncbi:MAG: hypothetical protein QGH15_07300 [Kiritimatiellia bacterium]|jgi:hypothetical protein|nr:hypothetical protein [Kiritimatiellia bacterium]